MAVQLIFMDYYYYYLRFVIIITAATITNRGLVNRVWKVRASSGEYSREQVRKYSVCFRLYR